MASEKPLLLTQRILEVQKSVRSVSKDGVRKDRNGNVQYNYVRHDDVVEALFDELAKQNLLVTSEMIASELKWDREPEGRSYLVADVTEKITIALAEPAGVGVVNEISFSSRASMLGYEATAVGIARSYAKKYGLLNFFLMHQGDLADPEAGVEGTAPGGKQVLQPQAKSGKKPPAVQKPPAQAPEGKAEPKAPEPSKAPQAPPPSEEDAFANALDEAQPAAAKADPPAKRENKKPEAPEPALSGDSDSTPIPDSDWEEARKDFHAKGKISAPQANRLFAMASTKGWKSEQVKALVKEKLGLEVENLPWGGAYNKTVEIFSKYEP